MTQRTVTTHAPALSSLTGYLLRRAYLMSVDCARSSMDPDANLRDLGILTLLDERGPMSQAAVADLMQINRTVMVKLVDALESEYYVRRKRNPEDRRAYALTVTDAGRRRAAELLGEFENAESALTEQLSAAQRSRLNGWLRRLVSADALATFPSLHEHSGYLITLAHREQLGDAQALLQPLGIEPRDFGVLTAIDNAAPCSQQQVADALGVTPPVVLWVIDELEARGLVQRRRNASDRRSYDLTLTPDGRRRLADAVEVVEAAQARIVDRLGARGDKELRRLLASILPDA